MKTRTSRGFTLIELLVVIAIIGILSSVVLASLNTARQKGRDARRISDLKQLQLALELNYDSSQTYPLALSTLATNGYISTVPVDPSTSAAYSYASLNNDNTACAATPCNRYVLGCTLEVSGNPVLSTDVDGTVATVSCVDPIFCVQP
ncbi:MAG TPA: type II secretion system protein [Candidatus Paceibacterota bacterium]|nr:type II secretion system protein [Candidatus Paceibacterota bacterium]